MAKVTKNRYADGNGTEGEEIGHGRKGKERALIIRTALGWQKKVKKHPNHKVDKPSRPSGIPPLHYKGRVQTRGKGILHSLPTSEQSR